MAALSPVASVEAFLSAVEKSGLLSAESLARTRAAAAQATDPKRVARDLIKDGTLTKWQAGQLLHGYHLLSIGKYKLLDQLSASDAGRMYLAEHAQMGRRHTLKVLAKRLASNPTAVKQFLDEARRACGLDHRNISHVYDVSEEGDRPFLVMEYVEGETLEQLIQRSGPLKLAQSLNYVAQAADGLAHAHESGVVHGELKPATLLLDPTGTIKILDIGQGRLAAPPAAASSEESGEMPVVGSAAYRAPEHRLPNSAPASVAGDIYSLGAVWCYLLTGKAPADAEAARAQIAACTELPPKASELCSQLMAASPAERPATMNEVLVLLAELAQPAGEPSKPDAKKPPIARGSETPEKTEKSGSAAAKPAESPSRAKPPPVAKAISDSALPIIIAGDKPPSVSESAPLGAVVIKTRGRVGKSPGAKEAREAASAAPEASSAKTKGNKKDKWKNEGKAAPGDAEEDAVQFQKTYTPLILAGSIGGGGVLLVILLTVAVWFFAFRKREPVDAPKATAQAQAAAPAPPAAPAESNPTESNPTESNPTLVEESNPTLAVAPTASPAAGEAPMPGAAPFDASALAAAAGFGGNAPPAPASPTQVSANEPTDKTKEPATEKNATAKANDVAGAESKTQTKPDPKAVAKVDVKPPVKAAEKTAAKPAAPQPAPAKAPPAKAPAKPKAPFDGFAAAVSLPSLGDAGEPPTSDALAPAQLGPCHLGENETLLARLIGGEGAIRSAKQKFELQPRAGGNRQWDFVLTGGEAPLSVATLVEKDGQMLFQWTADAGKNAAARQLVNCALELQTGTAQHVAALRRPVMGTPLPVDIEKPGSNVKWLIGDLPPVKQLYIEVTRCEGIGSFKIEPEGGVNPGDPIVVWAGDDDKSNPLGLKLNTSGNARGITVTMLPQIKLEGQEPQNYRRKELATMQQRASFDVDLFKNQLDKAKASRPKQDFEKMGREQAITKLTNELNMRAKWLDQMAYVGDFMAKSAGAAKVHFRVYFEAEEAQIELLTTDENPPPAKTK